MSDGFQSYDAKGGHRSRCSALLKRLGSEAWWWLRLFLVLLAAWCILAAIPSSGERPADALGSVWMGGLKIGNGMLIGVQDGERTHIAFLTARHVATANGFFRMPAKGNAVYLRSGGAFRCRRIGEISPERWFCAERRFDLAWFELSAEELRRLSREGGAPPYVLLGGIDEARGHSAVAAFDGERINSVLEGDAVEAVKTIDVPLFGAGFRLPPFPSTPLSVIFAGTRSGKVLKRWHECTMTMPLNTFMHSLPMRQSILQMPARRSDSGAPVFIGEDGARCPLLLGILVAADLEQGMSGFQPLQAADDIRKSLLAGTGMRLVDHREFW